MMVDPAAVIAASLLLAAGATVKGLLGIGLPMVAIPGLTLIFGLPQALAMVSIPVGVANLWQIWQFRRAGNIARMLLPFILAGGLGTAFGTFLLAAVFEGWLEIALAGMLFCYIALRLGKPDLVLDELQARRAAVPVGIAAGVLHGATGIAGPIAITFFHMQHLRREPFILATGAAFFGFTFVQVPMLGLTGILGTGAALVGVLSLPAVAFGLWLGNHLARWVNALLFDRLVLVVLGFTAIALLWRAYGEFQVV